MYCKYFLVGSGNADFGAGNSPSATHWATGTTAVSGNEFCLYGLPDNISVSDYTAQNSYKYLTDNGYYGKDTMTVADDYAYAIGKGDVAYTSSANDRTGNPMFVYNDSSYSYNAGPYQFAESSEIALWHWVYNSTAVYVNDMFTSSQPLVQGTDFTVELEDGNPGDVVRAWLYGKGDYRGIDFVLVTLTEPTPTPIPSPTPTPTPTPTPSPTPTPIPSPTPTPTPSPTPTPTPSVTPTPTPFVTPTPTPSSTPTSTPSPTTAPTEDPTPDPSLTPEPDSSAEPTASPTAEPTTSPTTKPTATPMPKPTATPEPTASPKPTATASPILSSDSNLYALSASEVILYPAFASSVTEYYANVANYVTSVLVGATASNAYAKVAGIGTHQLLEGTNVVNVVVTAQNGAVRTYRIVITRDAAISYNPSGVSAPAMPSSTSAPLPAPSPSNAPAPTAEPTQVPTNTPAVTAVPVKVPSVTTPSDSEVKTAENAVKDKGAESVGKPQKINNVTKPSVVSVPTVKYGESTVIYAVVGSNGSLTPVPAYTNPVSGTTAVLVSSSAVIAPIVYASKQYMDVKSGYWADEAITNATKFGIITGDVADNDNFRPNDSATVAEVASMFINAIGLPANSGGYSGVISAAQKAALLPSVIQSGSPLTRADAALMITNALKVAGVNLKAAANDILAAQAVFKDISSLSPEIQAAFAVCYKNGIFSGYGDSTMRPMNTLSRAEMAVLALKLRDAVIAGRLK